MYDSISMKCPPKVDKCLLAGVGGKESCLQMVMKDFLRGWRYFKTGLCYTSQNDHHQKKSINNKCWREGGEKGILYNVGGTITWCNHYGKHYEVSSKN